MFANVEHKWNAPKVYNNTKIKTFQNDFFFLFPETQDAPNRPTMYVAGNFELCYAYGGNTIDLMSSQL